MLYVSIHIPKTAGTSFGKSLTEALAPETLHFDYQHDRDFAALTSHGVSASRVHQAWLTESNLKLAWRYRNDLKALPKTTRFVQGHFPAAKYHPLGTWLRTRQSTFFITWVREPFARAISNYYFWRTFDANTMQDPLVKAFLLENWSLETYLFHPNLRNYQAMFLKGIPWWRVNFFGVTEVFSEDLSHLSSKIGIPLTPYQENIGLRSKVATNHTDLKEHFLSYHAQDAALYRYAQKRAGRALATGPES